MSGQRKLDDYAKVLAVEGYSDLLFFAELLEHLDKHDEVFIKQFNGAQDLMTKLETFLSPGLLASKSSIGIILDADDDAESRVQSISSLLNKLMGRNIGHGEWSPGSPQVGFFVVPDGQRPGEIETLVWDAWVNDPQNNDAERCIQDYVDCMEQLGFTAKSPEKGTIGALLAVRNDEDPRLGPGARTRSIFSFDRQEYTELITFLNQL